MARYADGSRELIDQTVDLWRTRCLLANGSLLFPDRDNVWTGERADDLYGRFVDTPVEGDFEVRWREQLEGASESLRLFAAETLLIHFLFASSVTRARKIAVVGASLVGTDVVVPEDAVAVKALAEGIGHPGIGFSTRRDLQVGYLLDFTARWKRLPAGDPERLLGDPWALRDFADDTERPVREMRHILLHLLRPAEFERISSGTHKRQIAAAFSGLLPDEAPEDLDEQLLAIRDRLEEYLPGGNTGTGAVDFYRPPLQQVWESSPGKGGEGVGDLDALLWKQQLVLYGPPGTSKTFQARGLAEAVVRRTAMQRWGPKAFFDQHEALDALVSRNVVWVQLHPGYGYEEFVRGLHLVAGETRYKPGTLFDVIALVDNQPVPGGLEPLPVVLVLDEINRTDLSRMLGEAFSLLERDQRGRVTKLPGVDASGDAMELAIPWDLYVIGTMNEIDQSVETLDFALRRRFLWRECPFERETLLEIVEDRWAGDMPSERFRFDDAVVQLERFADRAAALNAAVEESHELGRQYQVGHTYFADITFFLGEWLSGRKQRPGGGTYLWTAKGKPQPPLNDLWERALKPLLQQYLAASDVKDDEVERLRRAFIGS